MTTTPNYQTDDDQVPEMPPVCRPLFVALFDAVPPLPSAPLSIAADMVKADPAAAKELLDHLEAKGLRQGQISVGVLNALRSMVARQVARGVMDEIEILEGEK